MNNDNELLDLQYLFIMEKKKIPLILNNNKFFKKKTM